VATPATGQEDPGAEKARVDQRIAELQAEIDAAKTQQGVLTSQLSEVASELRAAQGAVDEAQSGLDQLEAELASEQARLERLTVLLEVQTRRLVRLQREYARAVEVLEQRVRAAYIHEPPDALAFIVSASSFADLIDNYEFVKRIGAQDQRIARGRCREEEGRRRA
jgi:peptidoglycan hydrolase CwlO-like protein